MKGIYDPIRRLSTYQDIQARVSLGEPVLVYGTGDSAQNHLGAALVDSFGTMGVVLTANDMKAREVYEDMQFYYAGEAAYFPAKDPLFYSADVHGSMIEETRCRVLKSLAEGTVRVLVMSVEALYDRMVPRETWEKFVITRRLGERLPLETFVKQLARMGYERRDQIEHAGQFAVRGGIIDISPVTDDTALRIELWGDEIDSIRVLDIETQRSAHRLESFTVYPAIEVLAEDRDLDKGKRRIQEEAQATLSKLRAEGLEEESDRVRQMTDFFLERLQEDRFQRLESYLMFFCERPVTILDYVQKDALLILEDPGRIREKTRVLEAELSNSIRGRMQKGYLLPSQMSIFPTFEELEPQIERFRRVCLCGLLSSNQNVFHVTGIFSLATRSVNLGINDEKMLLDELSNYNRMGYRTVLLAESGARAQRLLSRLQEEEIGVYAYENFEEMPQEGCIGVGRGGLLHGFVYPEAGFAVIAQKELTGRTNRSKKRRKRYHGGQQVRSFGELNVGDYVVHENHGVGIYQGIVQMEDEGKKRDFFKILYKDGGLLYVPTTSLDLLQRYSASEEAHPVLNKLGGTEWSRTKNKVRESVAKLAEDLVALYAEREKKKGFVYSKDTVWQKEFEETFPYEETDDQLAAIEDTKNDMEAGKVMDRLICGDVGYGKTEVALRAAFKAVQDGKQVAYLAPTTILAQQHYHTFVNRMRDFPVQIELLSRFRTDKELQNALRGARQGTVDILIGTHRLLSADVHFKDLGLLIVDEEQRFGVGHKEKIKALKKDVDVLTLTATPIPRTLHMSLSGIRDMSLLEEPPQQRQPVQTFVMEEDEELIREAIYREIGRGGQVFFLHNRVRSIDQAEMNVQRLVPEARVASAHGQMAERDLEDVMMRFVEGEIDVLVCTTIIETGLDIPNVNTILIENADTMGLAQLYQLRGRVGRSDRLAYAYFLYKQGKVLQEVAQKRLEAIGEFTEFGSGFKIAMRDLEIRGAGNVLGPEQHGHMGAVGYDLYCKLLEEAIDKARGETQSEDFETTVSVNIDAYIPSTYIANESQKLELYKKIAAIRTEEDYQDMLEEITDRYADPPQCVWNLVRISFIKALGRQLGIDTIEFKEKLLILSVRDDAPLDPAALSQYLTDQKGRVRMNATPRGTRLVVIMGPLQGEDKILTGITKELQKMQSLRKEKNE